MKNTVIHREKQKKNMLGNTFLLNLDSLKGSSKLWQQNPLSQLFYFITAAVVKKNQIRYKKVGLGQF